MEQKPVQPTLDQEESFCIPMEERTGKHTLIALSGALVFRTPDMQRWATAKMDLPQPAQPDESNSIPSEQS